MIQLLLEEHSYFSTAGRIGLARPKVQLGDRVRIFQWGDVPFILL